MPKCRPQCRGPHLALLIAVFTLVTSWEGGLPFSAPGKARKSPKQATASVMRERSGLGIGARVTDTKSWRAVSPEESALAGKLKAAGVKGRWTQVWRLYQDYTGIAIPVHGAAMQAAYRCRRYSEAAEMYTKLRTVNDAELNQVILVHGIKIFGKLHDADRVEAIWQEVLAKGWMDKFPATARIDAASEMGDIRAAASVLDYLQNASLPSDVIQFSSAINACKNSDEKLSYMAANVLLNRMIEEGLQPNIVTFTSFAGAHRLANLTQTKRVLSILDEQKVIPNSLFVETFLGAVFQGRLRDVWSVSDVAERIQGTSPDRVQFALDFLDDVEARGVSFSQLTCLTHKCLRRRASTRCRA
ncbi:unnamed protein product [Symbiodinium necroappetens]|uniref:Pentatricopeptide repeat-containing protein, chloroplastic n=1 Tax=Symbiodinium necroappetens TaxID=1628268 RepID=A0A813AJ26_9DINO|nr:unnamed protein product [Symbiodinium necroappetens]